MRVYLPATTTVLRDLVVEGRLPGPRTGFAVTPQLREFYSTSEAAADVEGVTVQLVHLEASGRTLYCRLFEGRERPSLRHASQERATVGCRYC